MVGVDGRGLVGRFTEAFHGRWVSSRALRLAPQWGSWFYKVHITLGGTARQSAPSASVMVESTQGHCNRGHLDLQWTSHEKKNKHLSSYTTNTFLNQLPLRLGSICCYSVISALCLIGGYSNGWRALVMKSLSRTFWFYLECMSKISKIIMKQFYFILTLNTSFLSGTKVEIAEAGECLFQFFAGTTTSKGY